jgi:hypothetical protein
MGAIAEQKGPVYGVQLIDTLPLGTGGVLQQMPDREELVQVQKRSNRTVAAYEVLLAHYQGQVVEVARLKELIRQVIAGEWNLTELQEAIGDI